MRNVRMQAKYIPIPNFAGVIDIPQRQMQSSSSSQAQLDVEQGSVESPSDLPRALGRTVLHTFVRTQNAQLFGNTIMKTVLDFKWSQFAQRLFMRELMIFGIHLFLFFIFTLMAVDHTVPCQFFSLRGAFLTLLVLITCSLSIRQLRNEYRQVISEFVVANLEQDDGEEDTMPGPRGSAVGSRVGSSGSSGSVGSRGGGQSKHSLFSNATRQHTLASVSQQASAASSSAASLLGRSAPGLLPFDTLPSPHFIALHLFSDGWNLLQVGTAVLTIISGLLWLTNAPWFTPTAGISAWAMWLEVLYYLRAFEFTGGLVRMVFKVFYYTGPFMLILAIVLIGSANCFYVLFRNVESEVFTPADYFGTAFFKTFKMLVLGDGSLGDFPESTHSNFALLVRVIFVVMMIAINIFMLNLMINLMDDFMQKINDEEGDAFPFEKARIISELEMTMHPSLLKDQTLFPRFLHVLSPKGGEVGTRVQDEWQGTVQAIRSENLLIERRTKEAVDRAETRLLDRVHVSPIHLNLFLLTSYLFLYFSSETIKPVTFAFSCPINMHNGMAVGLSTMVCFVFLSSLPPLPFSRLHAGIISTAAAGGDPP
eukprot:m.116055 g.116055  ORF g.116055 m.116055 type:complete len:594 (-) comp13589_c0_seq2:1508-3289(-)